MTKRALIMIFAAALMMSACGKKAEERAIEKAIEKQSGGTARVDLDKGTMTFKGKDGEEINYETSGEKMTMKSSKGESMEIGSEKNAVAIPADFPKDVFIYPGATPTMSVKSGESSTVQLSSADAMAKIAATYKEKMTAQGWTQETNLEQPQMIMQAYKKGERTAMVHIIPQDGGAKNQIALIVEEPKAQK